MHASSDTGPDGPSRLTAPGVVVAPEWVEQRLTDGALHLVDLRDAPSYAESHLPGAVQLDLDRLGTSEAGRDNVLLPPGDFAELMEELGVTGDAVVVAYDDQWGLAAARLVWALHFYGHPDAAVLDGGWDRWSEEKRPVTDRRADPARGRFEALPNPDVAADGDWIADRIGGGELALLDTRTSTEFEAGHLPGAASWDWFGAVPEGSWDVTRDPEELRAEWGGLGVDDQKEVVVYCRSGMRAAHTYVVLRHAGFQRVRLYDGSWQEWSMRESADANVEEPRD